MVENIKTNNSKTFEKIYLILNSHQTQKPTRQLPEYQTSTIDGDDFPAALQSMERNTPIQRPANGNTLKLSCVTCAWETGKLKQSNA